MGGGGGGERRVSYWELVDKPYMKIVKEKTKAQSVEQKVAEDVEEGDAKQPERNEEEEDEEKEMEMVTQNLQDLGYIKGEAAEDEEDLDEQEQRQDVAKDEVATE